MTQEVGFAGLMRKNTRVATTFRNKLVNLKFAMTIGTDDVYAEGVLAFYEIFKFLENAMRAQEGRNLGRLLIDGLARTQACVDDLNSYLGSNWVIPYYIRDPTLRYLEHLQRLYDTDPDLLIPYVYHLYMELLTGGQLIKTRKELDNIFYRNEGEMVGTALVDFGGEHNAEKLRYLLSREVNAIAEGLDEEKKKRLIKEGNRVFDYSSDIIRSIESVDRILMQRLVFSGLCILGVIIIYFLLTY